MNKQLIHKALHSVTKRRLDQEDLIAAVGNVRLHKVKNGYRLTYSDMKNEKTGAVYSDFIILNAQELKSMAFFFQSLTPHNATVQDIIETYGS